MRTISAGLQLRIWNNAEVGYWLTENSRVSRYLSRQISGKEQDLYDNRLEGDLVEDPEGNNIED